MKIKVSADKHHKETHIFIEYACNFLKIDPQTIEVDDLHVCGVNGMCIDLDEKNFLILVKNHKNVLRTLAHEVVHIRQYMKQGLGKILDGTNMNYENSWWEVEARTVADEIVKKYYENCKKV